MPIQPAAQGRRPRLLLLTPWYPHPGSPASGIFIRDQAEILADALDVLVYFLKPVPGRAILRDLLRAEPAGMSRDGRILVAAGRYHGMPNTARPLASWLAYRRCRSGIDAALRHWGGAPDMIHAHVALPAGLLAVRLGQELGVPVVVTEHTGPFSALLPRPGARRPVEEALAKADALLAVSPAMASAMQREFPALQPKVLGNVIRTDFFTPAAQPSSARYRFAALALMHPGKGLDILLHAARKLLDSGHSGFQIAIGGDGPERAMLERMAQDFRLAGHIQFLGMLDRSLVRSLFQEADAFVLPSLAETFGVALAEAMACGKPVIATRCGGPEYVVGAGDGILVPPNDADALADAMRSFCEKRTAWSSAAIRDSVERRFGPAAFKTALLGVYDALGAAGARTAYGA